MKLNIALQIIISFFVLYNAGRRAKFKSEDQILNLLLAFALGFVFNGYTSVFRLTGWAGYPISVIFSGGLGFVILINRQKLKSLNHEGSVFITSMTFAYLLTTVPELWQKILGGIFLPLLIILFTELVLPRRLGVKSRFFLAFLNSFCIATICFYQISYFDDFIEVLKSNPWDPGALTQSFFIQSTVFNGFLQFHWVYNVFEESGKKNFWNNFWNDAALRLANFIQDTNISYKAIVLAFLLHGLPLLINYKYEIVPQATIIFYAVMVSPWLLAQFTKEGRISIGSPNP